MDQESNKDSMMGAVVAVVGQHCSKPTEPAT